MKLSFCTVLLAIVCGALLFHPSTKASAAVASPDYERENWPEVPKLVWAKPGESGDFNDPANWLKNGQVSTRAPDRDTDVVLPPAPGRYRVNAGRDREVRHLTVGENAEIRGVHRNELEIWGNAWVKDGGWVEYISIRGPKNTFFRMDSAEFPTKENGLTFLGGRSRTSKPQSRGRISHKFEIAKYGDGSVELIGNIGVGDEIMVQHGRAIISGELRWSGVTDKGAIEVFDGAVLELQSGATIAPFLSKNGKNVYNVNIYRGGMLQGGSPERPLTSDAYVRLGYGSDNSVQGESGLFAARGSIIRVHSSDPENARLVFTSITGTPGFHDGDGNLLADTETPARGPGGIVLDLAGDVDLHGAFFDYVSEGGIRLINAEVRDQWREVEFGENNAGSPDRLFAQLEVDADVYYHERLDGASEFALTRRARQTMDEFIQQQDPYRISVSPESVQMGEAFDPHRGGRTFKRPEAVIFKDPIEVSIEVEVPGAAIHYTTDGSEVSHESPRYTEPLRIEQTTRLNVRAYAEGKSPSMPAAFTYVFEDETD